MTTALQAFDDADYEYGLRLNQLDLVTAFAGDRPEEAQLCLHQEELASPSGLPQRVRLSRAGREEDYLWVQHGPPQQHRPAVDFGQRLAGGDDKHSQPNAKLANGRQVCMRCARPSTRRRAGPWAPETGAAQQEQPSRHGSMSSFCLSAAQRTR